MTVDLTVEWYKAPLHLAGPSPISRLLNTTVGPGDAIGARLMIRACLASGLHAWLWLLCITESGLMSCQLPLGAF